MTSKNLHRCSRQTWAPLQSYSSPQQAELPTTVTLTNRVFCGGSPNSKCQADTTAAPPQRPEWPLTPGIGNKIFLFELTEWKTTTQNWEKKYSWQLEQNIFNNAQYKAQSCDLYKLAQVQLKSSSSFSEQPQLSTATNSGVVLINEVFFQVQQFFFIYNKSRTDSHNHMSCTQTAHNSSQFKLLYTAQSWDLLNLHRCCLQAQTPLQCSHSSQQQLTAELSSPTRSSYRYNNKIITNLELVVTITCPVHRQPTIAASSKLLYTAQSWRCVKSKNLPTFTSLY